MTTSNSKPNFSNVYSKANEILATSHVISTFPFCTTDLVKEQSSIKCRTYKKARQYGVDITAFGSESATIFEFGGKQILFYDETKPIPHINYSILHELGHSVNHHDFKIADEDIYRKYEIEANFFAAQLLMPEQLIREFQHRGVRITRAFLRKVFEVSAQAADKRIKTLSNNNIECRKGFEKEYDDIILFKYSNFLNTFCPIRAAYNFENEFIRQQERNNWY